MTTSMKKLLDHYLDRATPVQVRLKHDLSPAAGGPFGAALGPGTLKRVTLPPAASNGTGTVLEDLYEIQLAVTIGRPGQPGGSQMRMPLIFSVDDVLWLSTGPIAADDGPAIITPGDGSRRSSGGIHVPA